MDPYLDDKIALLFEGIPPLLKDLAREQNNYLKTKNPSFSAVEIYTQMETYVRLLSNAYMNNRMYLQIYNRRFVEMKMIEAIERILRRETEFTEADFYGIARINFDFNGLKALNDLGGHDTGNRGLRIFTDILKGGETTRWLEELGYIVIPSAEGAEEFGILICGEGDLRPLTQDIVTRYFKEVFYAPVGPLINFSHPLVREKLGMLGLADEIGPDFRFQIAANVGMVLLGEALAQVPIETINEGYDVLVRKIVAKMFAVADLRARAHRSAFKDELGKKNPLLSGLYARLSNEVIHLEKEINRREERIRDLEAKLEAGEPERAPAGM